MHLMITHQMTASTVSEKVCHDLSNSVTMALSLNADRTTI